MQFLSPLTALGPLSIYLIFLGLVNLSSKTRLLTGRQDFIALSLGVSGLIVVGPMQLFLPQEAMIRFGSNAWYPLILLYLFCTMWLFLLNRPRLILYNLKKKDLFCFMEHIVRREKWTVHAHGNVMQITEIGIQFEIISFAAMKNITLRATRAEQSMPGWQVLRKALLTEFQTHHAGFNRGGVFFVACGLIVAAVGWTYTSSV